MCSRSSLCHSLVVTVAFLVGRLMPRGRLLVAFVLLAGGIVGIGLWPQVAPRLAAAVEPIRDGERILKVASFNSWYDSQTPDLVQAEVARLDADVVATWLNSAPMAAQRCWRR